LQMTLAQPEIGSLNPARVHHKGPGRMMRHVKFDERCRPAQDGARDRWIETPRARRRAGAGLLEDLLPEFVAQDPKAPPFLRVERDERTHANGSHFEDLDGLLAPATARFVALEGLEPAQRHGGATKLEQGASLFASK